MISLPGRTAAQIFCCIWNVLWLWLMSLTAGSSASGLARSLHSVRSTWWAFHDKRHKTTQGGISKPPWTHASHCAHSFGHTQGSGTFFFFFSVGRRIPRIFRSFLTGSEIILAHWKRVLLCDESISVSSASQREMIWSYWLVHGLHCACKQHWFPQWEFNFASGGEAIPQCGQYRFCSRCGDEA